MSQQFDAIYENGVLRPLGPVEFREHQVLSVSATPLTDADMTEEAAAKQRAVLLTFVNNMEAIVDRPPIDDATNRDHDRLIYDDQS